MFLTAAAGTLIAINVACACLALAMGFAAGAWFIGGTRIEKDHDAGRDSKAATNTQLAAERAVLATGRLKDLASGIASEVGTHSAVVGEFNRAIHEASDGASPAADAALLTAMNKMIEANSHLQERLTQAEQQIEAQAAEIQSHQSEARTDSLTGLANRRAFDCELGRRIAEWQRKATPISLAILDIDFFKKFNDKHGHQAGDEVLQHVARKSSPRQLARWTSPAAMGARSLQSLCPPLRRKRAPLWLSASAR
jgi:diguanylate cyclase